MAGPGSSPTLTTMQFVRLGNAGECLSGNCGYLTVASRSFLSAGSRLTTFICGFRTDVLAPESHTQSLLYGGGPALTNSSGSALDGRICRYQGSTPRGRRAERIVGPKFLLAHERQRLSCNVCSTHCQTLDSGRRSCQGVAAHHAVDQWPSYPNRYPTGPKDGQFGGRMGNRTSLLSRMR